MIGAARNSVDIPSKYFNRWIYSFSQFLAQPTSGNKWELITILAGGKCPSCFVSHLRKVYCKRKEFAPLGSKFFHYRVDPFSEGVWCAEKQTGSRKHYLPYTKWRKIIRFIQSLKWLFSVTKHLPLQIHYRYCFNGFR